MEQKRSSYTEDEEFCKSGEEANWEGMKSRSFSNLNFFSRRTITIYLCEIEPGYQIYPGEWIIRFSNI